jgi:23S rRNA (cytidine1920-2'-O)/16S rRNA (cytidine1409-2'-O)-methyltransferase
MTGEARQRLDQALVSRGLAPSRSRARHLIESHRVSVGGTVETRPSAQVAPSADISVAGAGGEFVSRAAEKLAAALDAFSINPAGLECLDIGASTGGFTEVLLGRGCAHVTAIDVGHAQMADKLRTDPRVTLIEGLNARDLTEQHLQHGPPELIVCDVSFISLKLALPPALALAAPGCQLVALIKPQFEAGRQHIARGGIVRDEAVHRAVCADIETWLIEAMGWRVLHTMPSPVTGRHGNREFLIHARNA